MKVRLGYVSQNLTLGITPAHTITVKNFTKIENKKKQIDRLVEISKINLNNTLEILKWNVEHDIYVYRLSSKLIPLATWDGIEFDYLNLLKKDFKKVGNYIKENDIRVSAHPDHFSVINTPSDQIFQATIKDLSYHNDFMEAMGLNSSYKLVVHVGGKYGDKECGKRGFIHRYYQLPNKVQKRLIIENDDKSYHAQDVLELCQGLELPMVLDIHHFQVNQGDGKLIGTLKQAFNTWGKESFPPKIHFSTPKNEKKIRDHADYINAKDFLQFLKLSKKLNTDFDVMLEAKAKDLSLLDLKTKGLLEIFQ